MTESLITFDLNYEHKARVKEIVKIWENGAESFELMTSGSTGKPKTILLPRQLLIWSAEGTKRALSIPDHTEKLLCCLPIDKTGGFMQLIRALHFRWRIHFVNPSSNPLLNLDSKETSFHQVSLTPLQMENILRNDSSDIAQFKRVLIGGAPISHAQLSAIQQATQHTDTRIWETYGMTETASHIALRQVGRDSYFMNQEGVDLALEEGQLVINIPALNLIVKTTDIAKLHPNGFEIMGRADHVINSGGIKIHPGIIEPKIKEILSDEGIKRTFYVTKKPDSELGDKMILVMEKPKLKNSSALLSVLKNKLPRYTYPKEILFVDRIEYTDTGKVIRKGY